MVPSVNWSDFEKVLKQHSEVAVIRIGQSVFVGPIHAVSHPAQNGDPLKLQKQLVEWG